MDRPEVSARRLIAINDEDACLIKVKPVGLTSGVSKKIKTNNINHLQLERSVSCMCVWILKMHFNSTEKTIDRETAQYSVSLGCDGRNGMP